MLWPLEFRLEAALRQIHEPLNSCPLGEFRIIPAIEGVLQETSQGEHYWRESPMMNDRIFEHLGIVRGEYHSVWHAVSLGLENAFWRGNRDDPTLPVDVRIYRGVLGRVATIEDSGDGFDYHQKVTDFLAGRLYAQGKGSGFKALHQEHLIKAGYEGRGNILNITILLA